MAQAYLVLVDKSQNVLLVRKKYVSAYWRGRKASSWTAVHQAGRWAFPGGRIDEKDWASGLPAPESAALREFCEETGLVLGEIEAPKHVKTVLGPPPPGRPLGRPQYYGVVEQVSGLDQIVAKINEQVGPTDTLDMAPRGAGVRDWEFDLAVAVTINEAVQRFKQQVTSFSSSPVPPRPEWFQNDPLWKLVENDVKRCPSGHMSDWYLYIAEQLAPTSESSADVGSLGSPGSFGSLAS
jgi:8-oxo-dGTP pyrophosphatase MutT (NUDIX family)